MLLGKMDSNSGKGWKFSFLKLIETYSMKRSKTRHLLIRLKTQSRGKRPRLTFPETQFSSILKVCFMEHRLLGSFINIRRGVPQSSKFQKHSFFRFTMYIYIVKKSVYVYSVRAFTKLFYLGSLSTQYLPELDQKSSYRSPTWTDV